MLEQNPSIETSRKGRYLVFPDSALALPASIWQRVDPDALDIEVASVNDRLQGIPEGVAPAYYVSPEQRTFLAGLGSPAMNALVDSFDRVGHLNS